MLRSINSFFGFLLAMILPERIKRLLFVASLAGYVKATTELDDKTMSQINELFSLCTVENAMRFPLSINSIIWHERSIRDDYNDIVHDTASFSDARVKLFIGRVKSSIPKWMLYDNAQLDDDVRKLVTLNFVIS